jgi:nicotinate-nucleotide pyrophosphorylase (carboxylating)
LADKQVSKIKLSKDFIRNTVKRALNEDLYPSGDITSSLVKNSKLIKVKLLSNENAIVGGLLFVKQAFNLVDNKIKFKIKKKDGSYVKKGSLIATIEGNARNILISERVALNFLSHISGIATKTNQFVKLAGSKCKICCTRKTIPSIRVIQKYAVKVRWWYEPSV